MATLPRKVWLRIASDDFNAGRDGWAHRDIRFAVYSPLKGNGALSDFWLSVDGGDVVATIDWFALRNFGLKPAEIAMLTTMEWGGYASYNQLRRGLGIVLHAA